MDIMDGRYIARYSLNVGNENNIDTYLSFDKAAKRAENYMKEKKMLEIFHYFVSSGFVEIKTWRYSYSSFEWIEKEQV